ncbi:putative ribonuclease H-like domain-containing protein [Tanacetum coccineum]
MHVKFLENKSNIIGSGIESNVNAGQAGQEKASDHEYILLPLMPSNSPLSSSTQSSDDKDTDEVLGKGDDGVNKVSTSDDQERTDNSFQDINTTRTSINTASTNINTGSLNINTVSPNDLSMPSLEETDIFDDAYDDREVGAKVDLNNLETTMNVSPIPTTRIHKDHPKDQIIRDLNLATQTRIMINFSEEHEPKKVIQALTNPSWIEAMQEELLNKKDERGIVVRNKARLVAQGYTQDEGIDYDEMDVKSAFLYGTIEEEVWYETLSTYLLENGFRRGTIDKTLFIKKDKGDILLVQVYVDDIIFGSTKKSLCAEFEQMMQKRFQISSMGELTFFLGLQHYHWEAYKALIKDEEVEEVCGMFQVTPKSSHLHAGKRIFRYIKGQSKLGLWYPRDSPFDLEAFSDSDYAGASLDRKSTTGGCQFLGKRLISWQCKKQTIVANSTTEAEYVTAANCCGQVLWIQNQMLDYGFNFMNTKIYIDNESTICIVIKIHTDQNVADLLTKAFDVGRFQYLTASIGMLNL